LCQVPSNWLKSTLASLYALPVLRLAKALASNL